MKLIDEHEAYEKLLDDIPLTGLSWFAGWLCADGSIKTADQTGRPRITFQITDKDPLIKFAMMFGGTVSPPQKPSGLGIKSRYIWQISGWKCISILKRLLPWLSERYLLRANRAIKEYKIRQHYGIKLDPGKIADIQHKLREGKHGVGRKLAAEYSVSDGMISAIKHGRAWT